jgi:hypothetical protein
MLHIKKLAKNILEIFNIIAILFAKNINNRTIFSLFLKKCSNSPFQNRKFHRNKKRYKIIKILSINWQ